MSDASDLDQLDYYTLLGVEPNATEQALKQAFRGFALRYHPDRHAGAPPDKVARATEIYRRGSEAMDALSDPARRRAYDAGLAKGQMRLTADPKSPSAKSARASSKSISAPRRSVRAPAPPAKPTATLRTPSARAFYARAVEATKAGDHRAAWRALKSALEHEPGNPMLEAALLRAAQQML